MNILLLQNDLCIKDLSKGVIKKYPRSSVKDVSGHTFPSGRPVLTDKWLVRVKLGRAVKSQIESASKIMEYANFIFVYQGRSDSVMALLNEYGFEYKTINNTRPDVDSLAKYVKDCLGVNDLKAQHIVNRSGKYEPVVVKNVRLLSLLDKKTLTYKNLKKYLKDSSDVGIGFTYMYKYILLGQGSYEKVVNLVHRYRSMPDILCKFVIKRLESDINLFSAIMDGYLTRFNCQEYAIENKVGLYAVNEALLLFEKITLEALYAKLVLFHSLLGKSSIDFILRGCRK